MDGAEATAAGQFITQRFSNTRYRVLLVENHTEMRRRIRDIVASEHDIVGEIADGLFVACAVRELRPDVLLLDISMPGNSGFEVLRELAAEGLNVNITIVTEHAEPSYLHAALEQGVQGYVLKRQIQTELLLALQHVGSGGCFICSDLA
jgi:DNA-binding NarL/FixJ family response regulator